MQPTEIGINEQLHWDLADKTQGRNAQNAWQ